MPKQKPKEEEFTGWPPTQGNKKMRLYLEDVIRNKNFLKLLKKAIKNQNSIPLGFYDTWTDKEQKKHDQINNELQSIISGYELLRKRCKRLLRTKSFIHEEKIALDYGLNHSLVELARLLKRDNQEDIDFNFTIELPDMCTISDRYSEQMSPFNKGEEIIYLMLNRQLDMAAYPISLNIHQRASKRDVLDFIEKRWEWIENYRRDYQEKVLKIRERKHSQKMLDFIWEHKFLPNKKLKKILDEKFPKNGLVYYEISKIIQLETQRRNKEI